MWGAMDASRNQKLGMETASNAQMWATQQQIGAAERSEAQVRRDFAPFLRAGQGAIADVQGAQVGETPAPDLPDPDLEFELDENDPIYKWKLEQANEAANKALASRGLSDSRVGINVLGDVGMKVAAEEVDRQYGRATDKYNRQYGRATDLFNIGNLQEQQKYGKAIDLVKMGQGAAGSMGSAAVQSSQGIQSAYQNQGNALGNLAVQQGQLGALTSMGMGTAIGDVGSTLYDWWKNRQPNTTSRAPAGQQTSSFDWARR